MDLPHTEEALDYNESMQKYNYWLSNLEIFLVEIIVLIAGRRKLVLLFNN
jgi:hypothetical protein